MVSRTRRQRTALYAVACGLVIVLAACSTSTTSGRVATDCTVEDYGSDGMPTRSECGYIGIEVTLLGESGDMVFRVEQFSAAAPFLEATGTVPGVFASVDDAVAFYQGQFSEFTSEAMAQDQLDMPVTNGDGSAAGVVADYVSARDLAYSYELHGHELVYGVGTIDNVAVFGFDVTTDGLTYEQTEYMASPGHLTMTFPGPVGQTNGTVSGTQVRWEWDRDQTVEFLVHYESPGFGPVGSEADVGDLYDFDARTDATLIGLEIAVWFVNNSGLPTIEQVNGEYFLGADAQLKRIGYASNGVSFDPDASFFESPTSWCITMVHPLGTYASAGISYSALDGLQDQPCAIP